MQTRLRPVVGATPAGAQLGRHGRFPAAPGRSGFRRPQRANAPEQAQQFGQQREVRASAAASQLSQTELEELIAENAKLKQLLNTYRERLSPDQLERLTRQYEEIAALAAAAGLNLEPLDSDDAAAAAAGPASSAGAAKAVEYGAVKALVVDKGGVLEFKFDSPPASKAPGAAASLATQAAKAAGMPAAVVPKAAAPSAAPPAAAPADKKAAINSAVASFIKATKAKPAAGAPASSSSSSSSSSNGSSSNGIGSSNGNGNGASAAAAAAAPAPPKAEPPAAPKPPADAIAAAFASSPPKPAAAAAAAPAQAPAKAEPPKPAAAAAAAASAPPPAAPAAPKAASAAAAPKVAAPAPAAPKAAPAAAAPKLAPAAPKAAAAAPKLAPAAPKLAPGAPKMAPAAPKLAPAAPKAAAAAPKVAPGAPKVAPAAPKARSAPPAALAAMAAAAAAAPKPAAIVPPPPPAAAAAKARLEAAAKASAAASAQAKTAPPPPQQQQQQPAPVIRAQPVGPPPEPLDIPDPDAVKGAAPQQVFRKLSPEEVKLRDAANLKIREAARAELAGHNPNVVTPNRHSWLLFTVPEKATAGCEVIIYYNRAQSTTLRERNRIQAVVGYNQWEVASEGAKLDFGPSPIPHVDADGSGLPSDFWWARFKVPEDVYEMNLVFTDGESLFDNNGGQDFTVPLVGGITWEDWQAASADRAAAAEAERAKQEEQRREEELKAIEEERAKQDREKAMERVAELRDGYKHLAEGGVTRRKEDETDPTSKTMWYITPKPLMPGKTATLLYNSKAGPLSWIQDKRTNKSRTAPAEGQDVPQLLLGFNNWRTKFEPRPMRHSSVQGDDDELWWEVSFNVPPDACCVNFVVNAGNTWDNNGGKDHKITVELPPQFSKSQVAEWADTLFSDYVKLEREARLVAEKEFAEREARRLAARNKTKEKAKGVLRRQMRHTMFTEPEVIRAGEPVTVFYNPDETPLAGASEVWFTGGFNRWSHKRALGPAKMRPPGADGRHHRIRFNVPKDTCQLDFVFSDREAGGEGARYDNRGGFDYHLPIEGGTGKLPGRLHVAHIAVEMAPIAKVGGLGDVVTALARAVQEEGHLVEVILPRYDFFLHSPVLNQGQMRYETEFDWGGTRIIVTTAVVEGLRVFFIEPKNQFFATPTVYGRYDDEVRFDFFCKAALEFLLKTGRNPDILHCHDWSTAHVAKSFWEDYQPYGLNKPKVVFTIHNMNYGQKKIEEAAHYCNRFTTVSPTYAFEVGAHPAIAGNTHKFMGIRNGIDTDIWSPSENRFLPMSFDDTTMEEGKRRAREEVRKRVGLSQWQDKPIIAVVSRLTPQKGVHLIKHAAYKALERGCQFVLLGTAPDPKVQAEFDELGNELRHGQDAGFVYAYDEPLSHMIYAAADIIVVPSMFEPCGLTQMIAMRYGAVPVVRHTGGLRDTVFDVDNDKARAAWEVAGSSDYMRDRVDETNGFAFEGLDEGGLDYALNRAMDAYHNDRAWFRSLQARCMRQDWSWNRPALDYVDLYYTAVKNG